MLEIINIGKSFSSTTSPALTEVNLRIPQGQFVTLLGPSGCGKSTLLRIIAGLEKPSQGSIHLNGKDLTSFSARQRPFNLVFQKYALFPHMNVFDNIAFGLRMKKMDKKGIHTLVNESLELFNLKELHDRLPETLSGGQAQRVAVARALVNRPEVLLLDEPLSAIDKHLRFYLQSELRLIQRQLNITFLFVTHDQEEAFALSDQVVLMNQGRIEQVGSPQVLYHKPQSSFALDFIGTACSLVATLQQSLPLQHSTPLKQASENNQILISEQVKSTKESNYIEYKFKLRNGDIVLVHTTQVISNLSLEPMRLQIRPEYISLTPYAKNEGQKRTENQFSAEVIDILFKGNYSLVKLKLESGDFIYAQTRDNPQLKSHVWVYIDPRFIWILN